MMKFSKKTIAVSTTALVIAGGAAAYAWTVSGSGTGAASTSNPTAVSFQGSVSNLWPGVDQTVPVQFYNTNPGPVDVAGIYVTISGLPDGCTQAADFNVTNVTTKVTLPKSTPGVWNDLGSLGTVKVGLKDTAADACQNATGLTLTYATHS
jgi:hypothetical protein